MEENLAAANVNRSYSVATTNITIFTFILFFLHPKLERGGINPWLFNFTLVTIGVATFSLVFAMLQYYLCSVAGPLSEAKQTRHARRADRFWMLGCTLMFLAPSLVLFTLGLFSVAAVWFVLWLAYLIFVIHYFLRV